MRISVAGVTLLMLYNLALGNELSITPVEEDDGAENLPRIPWVAEDDPQWKSGEPLFTIASESAGTSAEGRVAVSNTHIHLHVVVSDDQHLNQETEGGIWAGDCIQVGIDALGNGDGNSPMDSNDAALAFALTEQGSEGWAYHLGRRGAFGPLSDAHIQVVRDETIQTTTYDIALPWSQFKVQPGVSPIIGIAIQVNDSDPERDQVRLYYGRGAGGVPQPGRFQKLWIGDPIVPVAVAHADQNGLWRDGDARTVQVTLAGQGEMTIRASLGDQQQEVIVPSSPLEAGVQRFEIRAVPRPLPRERVAMEVSVVDAEGRRVLHESLAVQASEQIFEELNARIDALVADSPHEVFTRHLRTVQAVANNEWQLARLLLSESTDTADHAASVVREILDGLEGDAAEWETYRQRRRKLVMGFMNPADRTVQYYMLSLPKDWHPEKTYPMIVFLHGGGTSHVALDIAAAPFRGSANSTAKTRFDGDFDTIYIEPYARGRHGYHGLGERDVLLSVEDAMRTMKVDPNRVYLTGFSAGGHGAWAIAARSPDRWAAVCINAGAPRSVPTGIGIGRNYLGLPTRVWHGDADPTIPVESGQQIVEEIRRYGGDPEFIVAEGVAHNYYDQPQESENLAWLLQHTRRRPNHFGFTADTREFLGRNGITLVRDPKIHFNPWFECRIEGNEVHLTSEGTPTLNVVLGSGGLEMSGTVTVFYEGKQVYSGPPVNLRVDTSDGTAREFTGQRRRRFGR